MAAKKSSTKAFNFEKLVTPASLLQVEHAEHDVLRWRLIELVDAIAEELTVCELHEWVVHLEHHPQALAAA